VHAAALLACFRPDLTGRPSRTRARHRRWRAAAARQSTPVQVEQQIAPVLRALERAIGEADQFLAVIPASRQSAAGNPAASLLSSAASASEKSPVAIPLRYRVGSSVSIRL
jgi:hypothetical protein